MRDKKKCTFVTGLKRLVIASVVAAMVTVSMGSVWGDGVVTASAATAKVKIDKKAFPDSKFKAYVKSNFDTNKDGYLSASEIKKVTAISVRNKGISNLEGVQYFTGLKKLDIRNNKKLLTTAGIFSIDNGVWLLIQ